MDSFFLQGNLALLLPLTPNGDCGFDKIDILDAKGCFSAFTHLVSRYAKTDADTKRIAGCLVAFGENIGLFKMASISDVSLQDLLTTAHNFIRLETLKAANDFVTNALAKLPIFQYF